MTFKIAQVATADCSIRNLLLDHIRALEGQGHDVTAICAPGPFVQEIRDAGVRVETVAMARELDPVRDVKSLAALRRVFRRQRFDVVHTHTPKAGLLGPLAARLAGVPVVLHTIHGLLFHDGTPRWKRRLFWMAERFTAAFSDHLLSQSSEDVDSAVRAGVCPANKISYLGNGIDVARFSPTVAGTARARLRRSFGFLESDFVVGAVSRLVYEKGCGELLAAAERLTARNAGIKFLIVGPQEPDQKDAIPAERIAALGSTGAIVFAGWRADMAACYAAMDSFLLPSHREGIPRACMEAAAMERPVIATDIRGCREVVRHGETGLLVPVKNVDAIVDAVEELGADRARAAVMGVWGRRHILRNFDHRQVLARLVAFYSRLENGSQRQRIPA